MTNIFSQYIENQIRHVVILHIVFFVIMFNMTNLSY